MVKVPTKKIVIVHRMLNYNIKIEIYWLHRVVLLTTAAAAVTILSMILISKHLSNPPQWAMIPFRTAWLAQLSKREARNHSMVINSIQTTLILQLRQRLLKTRESIVTSIQIRLHKIKFHPMLVDLVMQVVKAILFLPKIVPLLINIINTREIFLKIIMNPTS